VQFAEVVSAPAQWAKQSVAIRLNAPQFHTGAQMAMKSDHHLQLKRPLRFLRNGIAQSADSQLVAIAPIHQVR
jgi:hypothetical protein